MPLLTKMDSLREDGETQHSLQRQQQQQDSEDVRGEKVGGYENFEEFDEEDECVDSDMEGSIIHRGRPKKAVKAPALPQRSEKRTSMLLQNVMLELQSLDGSREKEADNVSIVQESDPLELYLSSEEDASLSDDYDDTLSDFEETGSEDVEGTRESSSRASSRKSQEDTARVVSFISVGKPQIIDIYVPSISPSTTNNRYSLNLENLDSFNNTPTSSPQKSTRRPTPLKLYPAIRRMSISSITASHFSSSSSPAYVHPYAASTTNLSFGTTSTCTPVPQPLPPRKSSRLGNNLTSLITNAKASFLHSDPFSGSTSYIPTSPNTYMKEREDTEVQSPVTPKTPTSMAAAAWKKTLSRARKPSMPKLSLAYTAGVVPQRKDSDASPSKLNLEIPPAPAPELEEVERRAIEIATRTSLVRNISSSEEAKAGSNERDRATSEDIVAPAGSSIMSPTSVPTPKERRLIRQKTREEIEPAKTKPEKEVAPATNMNIATAFGRLVRSKSMKGRPSPSKLSS